MAFTPFVMIWRVAKCHSQYTHTHTRTCSTQGQNSLFTTWSNNVTWNTKLWVQQETERKGIIWQAQDLLSPLSSTFVIHPLYCGSHSRNTPHTHQTHVQHLGIFLPWSRGGWRVTLERGTVQHKNRPFSPQDTISTCAQSVSVHTPHFHRVHAHQKPQSYLPPSPTLVAFSRH